MMPSDQTELPEGIVPLFPLTEHVLLPAAPTPYRIFEPRYRQMVKDLLDKPADERWIVVPRIVGAGSPQSAAIDPIATLGRVSLATPLADGDFLIVVEGLFPCRVEELDAPFTPYRVARLEAVADEAVSDALLAQATTELIQATFGLVQALGAGVSQLPIAYGGALDDRGITYRIGAAVMDDVEERHGLLGERRPLVRVQRVHDALVGLIHAAACGAPNPEMMMTGS